MIVVSETAVSSSADFILVTLHSSVFSMSGSTLPTGLTCAKNVIDFALSVRIYIIPA